MTKERSERKTAQGGWLSDDRDPCPSCGKLSTHLERKRGRRVRGPAPRLCIGCQDAHPGGRWCDDCKRIEYQHQCPEYLRRRDQADILSGRTSRQLGERRNALLEQLTQALGPVHGTTFDQCMCCFKIERRLMIDHDHDCCPAGKTWQKRHVDCTRGLICQDCNAIEGKIRTIYGPPFPRLIQEYLDRYEAHRLAQASVTN